MLGMRFLAFQMISLLLLLQLSTVLCRCDIANWWQSLDAPGWSVCPRQRTYITGFWRNEQRGTENIFLLEEARCCNAVIEDYANKSASCVNANWQYTLDGNNVWAKCPTGYYLSGIRISHPVFLSHVEKAKCCRPQNHPNNYEGCYEEDVSLSFDKTGWSECKRSGYYMAGFYKGGCNGLNCIEKFYCCEMYQPNHLIGKR